METIMARLPAVKREDLAPEFQAVWDRVAETRGGVGGPSAIMMHHPALGSRTTEVGAQLRFSGVLSDADRELTILTAGREVEATYEWAAHEPLGVKAGVSPAAIEVLRHQHLTADLPPHEALIIDTVRALYRQHKIPADLYAQAEAALGRQGLIELVVLAGYYGMIGFLLNGFEADLPAGVTPAFAR
jgi:4-carboxymuconolactone decarboxylase